jgi:hypothetical protein
MSRRDLHNPRLVAFARVLGAITIAALFGSWPTMAQAEPMYIGFLEMMERSDVIAVARLAQNADLDQDAHRITLEFLRILKGNVKPGTYRVTFADRPHGGPAGKEFVAFFRKGLCWRFVAYPVDGRKELADSLLMLTGFCDYNSYIVDPDLITLDQIAIFLKKETLTYHFRGPLYFPTIGQAAWQASKIDLDVTYDAVKRRATLQGLPKSVGFSMRPRIRFDSWWSDSPVIDISDGPLQIRGNVVTLDKGLLQTRFSLRRPDVLTADDLAAYLADPLKGHSYYRLKLDCQAAAGQLRPKPLMLTLGKEQGVWGQLEGWTEQPLQVMSISYVGPNYSSGSPRGEDFPPNLPTAGDKPGEKQWSYKIFLRVNDEQYLVLRFEIGAPPNWQGELDESIGVDKKLLYALIARPVPGTMLVVAGNRIEKEISFTASLDRILYAQLNEPRSAAEAAEEEPATSSKGQKIPEDFCECEHGEGGEITSDSPRDKEAPAKDLPLVILGTALALTAAIGLWIAGKRRAAAKRRHEAEEES